MDQGYHLILPHGAVGSIHVLSPSRVPESRVFSDSNRLEGLLSPPPLTVTQRGADNLQRGRVEPLPCQSTLNVGE